MQFLGLDVSTQSISAIIVDFKTRKIVYSCSLAYDRYLPHYHTENGVIRTRDPRRVHSDPLMWVEALDMILEKIKKDGLDLGKIKAISGSAQQHGSVYLNNKAGQVLSNLNPERGLKEQLRDIFSRKTSPVWMDSSTREECKEIMKSVGGEERMARLTGSLAFERFTGPQIRRFYKKERPLYEKTETIALVSSFMASLLLGGIAPLDYGDGSGTNLMDIAGKRWPGQVVAATAPRLFAKLPRLVPSTTIIGRIHNYFVRRYGFREDTLLNVWSGDNPNSLIGMGVVKAGEAIISLGTSDTLFAVAKDLNVDSRGEGHVFVAPTGDYMNLVCFKNGSLARERIRKMFRLSWLDFSRLLRKTLAGNKGKVILPWFEPEIVPLVLSPGIRRILLEKDDAAGHVRGVVEAQFMSMKIHSAWMKIRPRRLYVTGGASQNKEILKVIANIFNTPVYYLKVTKSAALGAALRASHSYFREKGKNLSWPAITRGFVSYDKARGIKPEREAVRIYDELIKFYQACETQALFFS